MSGCVLLPSTVDTAVSMNWESIFLDVLVMRAVVDAPGFWKLKYAQVPCRCVAYA